LLDSAVFSRKIKKRNMKKALVCGAGGFIGSHLVRRLKQEGYEVVGADLKYPEFSKSLADGFICVVYWL
jgi:nucleoside-diphosphate-sugar epimerase